MPINPKQLSICIFLASLSLSHQACSSDTESTEPEPTPFVVPDHPYMLVTADRKTQILENIESETLGHIYERIQTQALKELQTPEPGTWEASVHGDNGEVALFNAFIAWLYDDADAAARSIAAMDMLETNWDDHTQWGINIRMPESLMHYTAAWDFLSATAFFSNEQAQSIEAKLTAITEQFYDYYVLDAFYRGMALEVAQNNHPIRTAACIGFVALAFQDHPSAKEWLDWSVSELDYLMGPDGQYIQADGGISEGPHYFSFGFAPTVAFFIAVENRQDPTTLYNRNCINRSNVDPWSGHGCVDDEPFTYPSPIRSELMHDVLDWSLSIRLPQGHRAPVADSPLRNQAAQALAVALDLLAALAPPAQVLDEDGRERLGDRRAHARDAEEHEEHDARRGAERLAEIGEGRGDRAQQRLQKDGRRALGALLEAQRAKVGGGAGVPRVAQLHELDVLLPLLRHGRVRLGHADDDADR